MPSSEIATSRMVRHFAIVGDRHRALVVGARSGRGRASLVAPALDALPRLLRRRRPAASEQRGSRVEGVKAGWVRRGAWWNSLRVVARAVEGGPILP